MEAVGEMVRLLCAVAMLSAVTEVLLAGRKGSEIVCLLLSLAGVSGVLSFCADIRL